VHESWDPKGGRETQVSDVKSPQVGFEARKRVKGEGVNCRLGYCKHHLDLESPLVSDCGRKRLFHKR
jgi:hypothetical protein